MYNFVTSINHRLASAPETAPPDGADGITEATSNRVIACSGFSKFIGFMELDGAGGTCTATPYYWDSGSEAWYPDPLAAQSLTAPGRVAFVVEPLAPVCQFRVTALTGTDPTCAIRVSQYRGV